jgi:CBS domain-containing protein
MAGQQGSMEVVRRTVRDIIRGRSVVTINEYASFPFRIHHLFLTSPRNQSVYEAFELERQCNVHRLPVIADGKLVGILSVNDIRLCMESPCFHTNRGT